MRADERVVADILIVDDTIESLQLLKTILSARNFLVRPATSGQQALQAARTSPPDLILLDIMMPRMNGFEVCQQLKADERLAEIPVIFLSALDELPDKIQGFEVGGVDYITKPFEAGELLMRVTTHLELARLRKRDKALIQQLNHEIAERQRLERQRIALQLEKERSKLLANFIQDAAHEFRTPLSIISSGTYLLSKMTDADEKQTQLADIMDEIQKISTLLDAMLELQRLSHNPPLLMQAIDLKEIIYHVQDNLKPMLQDKKHQIQLHLPDKAALVQGNSEKLGAAIQHIVKNAVQFSPAQGRIDISIQHDAGYATIQVSDNGRGIGEEAQPYIFQLFYREDTARTIRGFGLGLPIARKIIELHQGNIEFESKPGKGSTFLITLPLAENDSVPETH